MPEPSRPISEVVPEGDLRASLVAIRDRLALETDEVGGRDLVAVTKRLSEVLAAIAALPDTPREGSRLDDIARARGDDLAQRRARRVAGA